MGLLDDAIRDHLQLKRLRGADPGVLDRAQREALDPAVGAEETEFVADIQSSADDGMVTEADSPNMTVPWTATTPVATPVGASGADSADVAQETAELDMRKVFGEGEDGLPAQNLRRDGATTDSRAEVLAADHGDDHSAGEGDSERRSSESASDLARPVPYTQGP
jgi:hypothetical protein